MTKTLQAPSKATACARAPGAQKTTAAEAAAAWKSRFIGPPPPRDLSGLCGEATGFGRAFGRGRGHAALAGGPAAAAHSSRLPSRTRTVARSPPVGNLPFDSAGMASASSHVNSSLTVWPGEMSAGGLPPPEVLGSRLPLTEGRTAAPPTLGSFCQKWGTASAAPTNSAFHPRPDALGDGRQQSSGQSR